MSARIMVLVHLFVCLFTTVWVDERKNMATSWNLLRLSQFNDIPLIQAAHEACTASVSQRLR